MRFAFLAIDLPAKCWCLIVVILMELFYINHLNMLMVSFDHLLLAGVVCDNGRWSRLLCDIIKQLTIIECNETTNDGDDKTCREQI